MTVASAGVTVTVAVAAATTVTVAVPVCPSLVAVIVVLPAVVPAVTTPVLDTVATAVLLDVQVTVRPVSVVPFASFVVAVNCTVAVWPAVSVAVDGETVTVATGGGLTVIAAVPVLPSLVAVIVAVPWATAVTTPVTLTVATAVLLDVHVMVRPESTLPFASVVVAVSVVVCVGTNVAVDGVTVTVLTGAGAGALTVMADVPVLPSLVAVIVAEPGATAVTTPVVLTVATAGLLELHVITRPESVLPLASFVVAASVPV